ncbi:hypothetical protein GIB67_041502, partial [Kingdonia uniflora]
MMFKQLEVVLAKLRTLANFDGDGRFANTIEDEVEIGKKFVEKAMLEAGVVMEDLKKFDGDGFEMKHLEVTTEREVHHTIDLVGGKDGDMSESSRSSDNRSERKGLALEREVVEFGINLINPSGLNGALKQRDVRNMRIKFKLSVLALVETKVISENKRRIVNNIASNWNYMDTLEHNDTDKGGFGAAIRDDHETVEAVIAGS